MRIALLVLLILVSCSSYQKRKECEKVNWFEHGFDVAMSGKRLNGDTEVLECRRVEAKIDEGQLDVGFKAGMEKYCQEDVVLAQGKRGEFFSPDFCAPAKHEKLRALHLSGVKQFCKKSNGVTAGSSGYVYNQICPENLEKDFLPEYRKGRKKFLSVQIQEKTNRRIQAQREIENLEESKRSLEIERANLSGRKTLVTERVRDSATGEYRETQRWESEPGIDSRIWTLDHSIRTKDAELGALKSEIQKLGEELLKNKAELEGIESLS